MKRHIWAVLCLCMAVVVCSGCVEAIELTEGEQEIIAEYAASALLDYDKGYNSKYQTDAMQEAKAKAAQMVEENGSVVETEEPKKTEKVKKTATPKATEESVPTVQPIQTVEPTPTPEPQPDVSNTDTQQASSDVNRLSPYDVGRLFGMEGVEVNYNGFEALDAYPNVSDNQLAFTMSANQGSKLIVAKFELVNSSDSAKTCNVVGQNIKFQMRFNNADYVAVQKTLLEDDFALVNTVLQPGESKKVVVISQVAAGYESTISSVDLIARIGGENTMFKLQ